MPRRVKLISPTDRASNARLATRHMFEFCYPAGFEYLPDWISQSEEDVLLRNIGSLAFEEVRMHGVVAKRQVVHFGWDYGYDTWCLTPTRPLPAWLIPFRNRAACLLTREPDAIEQALISRYRWERA